jgi:hypothetical protein
MGRSKMPVPKKIRITIPAADREAIVKYTFADDRTLTLMARAKVKKGMIAISLTPDALEDLLGYIAAECNHAKNKTIQVIFDKIYDRLEKYEEDQE